MKIDRIDHVVLTVADIEKTCEFYSRVLNMEVVTFGENRRALRFGRQKFNLHEKGKELRLRAKTAMPGAVDICLITESPIEEVVSHLRSAGVSLEEGPVEKTGAIGPMLSVYFRDLDGNLIEVSRYNG
jgi:catechol 2,3-dioxygenase-like lactoylglutathione lyase family enzyme